MACGNQSRIDLDSFSRYKIYVSSVAADSPASGAGFRERKCLVSFDGLASTAKGAFDQAKWKGERKQVININQTCICDLTAPAKIQASQFI